MASDTSRLSKTLGRPAPSMKPTKPLVLLCDGTWCGRETGTETNVLKLAEMMGFPQNPDRVFYLEGVGIGGSFLEYASLNLYTHDKHLHHIVTSLMVLQRKTSPVSAWKLMNSLSKIIHIQIMRSGYLAYPEVPTWLEQLPA